MGWSKTLTHKLTDSWTPDKAMNNDHDTIDIRKGGLEIVTFSDVHGTSPGYGHVIDHTRPRRAGRYAVLRTY